MTQADISLRVSSLSHSNYEWALDF